jgi:hypothetical protein
MLTSRIRWDQNAPTAHSPGRTGAIILAAVEPVKRNIVNPDQINQE